MRSSSSCRPTARPALDWVGHPELRPPVALLGWVLDEPRRAAFLPFAEFSPEWCAFRWAVEHGAALRAIDLPLANVLAGRRPTTTACSTPPVRAGRWTHWPSWPRPPAIPIRSGGGRTSSSTAAMARRRSPPSPRRWLRSGAAPRPRRSARSDARRTCARPSAERSATASSASPWSAARGTSLRWRPSGPAAVDARTLRGIPQVEGRGQLGAVDPPAALGRRHARRAGLRRGRAQPRLVRPRLRPSRRGRRHPLVRRRRPPAAPPRPAGVARPPHRRHPGGRRARRASAAAPVPGWPRCSTPPRRCWPAAVRAWR